MTEKLTTVLPKIEAAPQTVGVKLPKLKKKTKQEIIQAAKDRINKLRNQ